MHADRGSRPSRTPLSPLQSNTLAPRSGGVKAGEGGSRSSLPKPEGMASQQPSSGSGGSRIPAAPAGSAETMQRPGGASVSRIPRGPSPTAEALAPPPPEAAFSSHTNPLAFDSDDEAAGLVEEGSAASPALSWRTDASRQRDLTPGMLDAAIYTPATARSIQAWLRSNTPGRGTAPATACGPGPTPLIPTPEAWQILEHMQQGAGAGSPAQQGRQGMFSIVNAYLRTGAQVLSPEPGCEGGTAIPAPAVMAAVVNRGPPLLNPSTAVAVAAAAASPQDPGSVRSSSVSSCNAAPSASLMAAGAAVAAAQGQQVPCVQLAPAVHAHDELPGSLGLVEAAPGKRPGPPSPISFNLPAANPSPDAKKPDSPTFSFGMGAGAGGTAGQGEAPPAALAEVPAPEMARIDSDASVDQPNPFKAMLCHLRGPQYMSPAIFAPPRGGEASPQSPSGCTPVLLLPSEHQAIPASAATPELGRGSLTQWIDRRGLRQALNTPARQDLQLMWAAMRDNQHVRGEAEAVRQENAALGRELERVQDALRALGVEYQSAVEAAEASQVYADAEISRAREAAQQMVELSNQIQQMFNLCEAEKAELMAELAAAQQRLAVAEAGPAGTNEVEHVELEKQVEDARAAVTAAQRAADLAEARANDACMELCAIKAELQATQQQLAAGAQAAVPATPLGALRAKLAGVQDALAGLHSKQAAVAAAPLASPSVAAKRSELQALLAQSKEQLGSVQALLGGEDEVAQLHGENQALRQQLQEARALLAANTPASAKQQERNADLHALFGSPTPLRLSAEFGAVSEPPSSEYVESVGGRSYSLAGSTGAVSPAPSDLFSSPFIASQATLTVDYRELHDAVLADTAATRGFSPLPSPECSEDLVELGSPTLGPSGAALAPATDGDDVAVLPAEAVALGEQAYTVMHHGFIITNVPASEVSKVKSMVQYWEAVANGHVPAAEEQEQLDVPEQPEQAPAVLGELEQAPVAFVPPEEGPAAESLEPEVPAEVAAPAGPSPAAVAALEATASIVAAVEEAAASIVAAVEEAASPARAVEAVPRLLDAAWFGVKAEELPVSPEASQLMAAPAAAISQLAAPALPAPVEEDDLGAEEDPALEASSDEEEAAEPELRSHPLATPFTISARSWTPPSAAVSAARCGAASPLQLLPEGLAATPPPASAAEEGGSVASTPARTPLNFVGDVPPAPHSTPVDLLQGAVLGNPASAGAASTPSSSLNVTPLALSALRRAGSSDMQAAVRNRLARLKQELQKAQVTLHSVDQGLAAITSPASSAGQNSAASTPMAGRPGTPTTAQKAPAPFRPTAAPAAQASSPAGSVSTAAACASPLGPRAAAPAAPAEAAPTAPVEAAPAKAAARRQPQPAQPMQDAENQDANAAPPVVAATPPVQKTGVRFAEGTTSCSPGRKLAARPGAAAASPGVGSNMRRASPGSAARRASPGVLRSSTKPAAPSPLRRAALDSDSDSSDSESDSDDEDVFDRSRMAVHAVASTPKAAKTPMAHPEGPLPTPQSMAHSSTSSFNPPEPLALMSIKPLGRVRRAPAGVIAGRRRPSETEEREFRRRAAALKIQISPYFKRR